MSEFISEEQYKKKAKKFTILGIFLIVLGFVGFFAGPICAFLIHPIYGLISMGGILFLFPGFVLLSLGTQRKLAAFQAQSVGPVAVDATKMYGREVVKEMAAGAKEGFSEEKKVFCKYCGEEIDADSDFCKFCGKKLK